MILPPGATIVASGHRDDCGRRHDPLVPPRRAVVPVSLRYALAPVAPSAARGLGLARTLPGSAGVALTFDDGPHPEGTPAVLDLLARAEARATFFLVGEQVQRRPGLAAEIAAAGHVVALHAHRHQFQLRLSAPAVRSDLARGAAAIEDATGIELAWHRPPYGIYSPAGRSAACAAGLRTLLWSRWGKDWRKCTTPDRIAARVTAGVAEGDVILLHDADFYSARDSYKRTVTALSIILDELERRKLGTVLPV
jgi:peptidoglycan-N-acetylglucosamine deacetylase